MKHCITIVCLVFTMHIGNYVSAQKRSIFIGTQIPLTYSLGLEQQISNRFSINLQGGVLTKPYDVAILEILKLFGTDEPITNTIGDAFDIGISVQPTVKYHFKKYYLGVSYSYFTLYAKQTPAGAMESYYGVSFPARMNRSELQLNSQLHNAGILFGREIQFKNPTLKLFLEFSILKTVYSQSSLKSENYSLTNINAAVNEELTQYYRDYGYLPSINIFFVKSF